MPEIQRINSYCDDRFSQTVLLQHGAFLVDGIPCEVEIIGADSAVVRCEKEEYILPLIEEFRFYAEHICRFCNEHGELLAEFPPVDLFSLQLSEIQPSQFYVDEDKLRAVQAFLSGPKDIVIPVMAFDGKYVSLDGHTRLAAAADAGYETVSAFISEAPDSILDFAREARRRGVLSPYDMKRVSHEEYEILWNRFCDEFLKGR